MARLTNDCVLMTNACVLMLLFEERGKHMAEIDTPKTSPPLCALWPHHFSPGGLPRRRDAGSRLKVSQRPTRLWGTFLTPALTDIAAPRGTLTGRLKTCLACSANPCFGVSFYMLNIRSYSYILYFEIVENSYSYVVENRENCWGGRRAESNDPIGPLSICLGFDLGIMDLVLPENGVWLQFESPVIVGEGGDLPLFVAALLYQRIHHSHQPSKSNTAVAGICSVQKNR